MKTILVDFRGLVNGCEVASQGLKIFLHRHSKTLKIMAFGSESDLNTFDENENFEKLVLTDETDVPENELLCNALKHKADAYIGATKKEALLPFLKATIMDDGETPFWVTSFPTVEKNRRSILSVIEESDIENVEKIAKKSISISENLISSKDMSFYLVSPNKNTRSSIYQVINEKLETNASYRGFIFPNEILTKGNSILLLLKDDADFIIGSIQGAISAYDAIKKEQTDKGFVANLGNMIMKNVFNNIDARIDKKMTSNGIVYLGFTKCIVFANENTNANGFAACLERAYRLTAIKEE